MNERVPVDLFLRRHFRITPITRCGLQMSAETKFEIVKANDNNICTMPTNDNYSKTAIYNNVKDIHQALVSLLPIWK